MKNITIVLPIHKMDDYYKIMFDNAVSSLDNFYNDVILMIVHPKKLKLDLEINPNLEVIYVTHNKDYGFCSQVNEGISKCQTEWFSILEIDDEYRKPWLSSMNQYMDTYKDVDVFLPIVKDINLEGTFLSFTNESVWAYGFCENQGFLDNEVLLDFQNYQISGGLYRTNVIHVWNFHQPFIAISFQMGDSIC